MIVGGGATTLPPLSVPCLYLRTLPRSTSLSSCNHHLFSYLRPPPFYHPTASLTLALFALFHTHTLLLLLLLPTLPPPPHTQRPAGKDGAP